MSVIVHSGTITITDTEDGSDVTFTQVAVTTDTLDLGTSRVRLNL